MVKAVRVTQGPSTPAAMAPRILLTKQEAADSLGMSRRHFERHVQPFVRFVQSGQLTLFSIRELERWAEQRLDGRAA